MVTNSALVWNSDQQVFYFISPWDSATNPNTIGTLDPFTQNISYSPIPSGTPDSMSISDDNQYLYVSSSREQDIQRLKLPDLTLDLVITAPAGLHDVKPAPGAPHTIAVSLDRDHSPVTSSQEVLIYDDDVQRSATVPFFVSLGVMVPDLAWGKDGTQLFGRDVHSSEFTLHYFNVDANGVTIFRTHKYPTSVGGDGIVLRSADQAALPG